jgi:hypothetical protein
MQIGLSLSLTAQLRSSSTYAVLGYDPALVFDFKGNYFRKIATASTFAASITHTRASSATMVDSSGTLVTVGNNVPRTGHHIYNGSAWVNEGILHESEARTNLMTSSGDLDGTGWTGNMTRGAVTSGSPFGTYQTISPVGSGANLGGAQRYQIGKTLTLGQPMLVGRWLSILLVLVGLILICTTRATLTKRLTLTCRMAL